MTAISTGRTRDRLGDSLYVGDAPMAAVAIVLGEVVTVILGTGYATNGVAALTHRVLGVATKSVDNSAGAAGDKTVPYEVGVFRFANADSIAQADVGKTAYLVDNNTAAKLNTGARPVLGTIIGLHSSGDVYVLVGITQPSSLISGAGAGIQTGTGTFAAGVLAVSTGITVTASTRVIAFRTNGAGTQGDEIRVPTADRTVGAPGTGALTFRSFLNGAAATSDTSAFEYTLIG
jgi:hypothetical protein